VRLSTPAPAWPGYGAWTETVLECRAEFVRVARSFWLVPEIIPPVARDDVSLLYCFCRRLDDAIDDEPDPDRARGELARFRDELHGRSPARPLVAAFVARSKRSGLPLGCADYLLEGMEIDLRTPRMADEGELLRYAYRVSSAVGLMLAPLLDVRDVRAHARIVDLGLALQISNVLLGVEDDARRGRVYLPESRLRAQGLRSGDVLAHPTGPRLAPVLRALADLAGDYYRSAEEGAAFLPLRYRHGIVLFGRLYGELGRRAAAGERAPVAPSGLPLRTKLGSLATLAALATRPVVMGIVPPRPHDRALHRALDPSWPGVHA
jgi:phytoene synthase